MAWVDLAAQVVEEFASVAIRGHHAADLHDRRRYEGRPFAQSWRGVRSTIALAPDATESSDVDSLVVAGEVEEYRRRVRIAAESVNRGGRRRSGYVPVEHPYLINRTRADARRERRIVELLEARGRLNRRQAWLAIGGLWRDFLRSWAVVSERRPELVDPRLPPTARFGRRAATLAIRDALIAALEGGCAMSVRIGRTLTGGSSGTVTRLLRDLRASHPHLFERRAESSGETRDEDERRRRHAERERARLADPRKRAERNRRRREARRMGG